MRQFRVRARRVAARRHPSREGQKASLSKERLTPVDRSATLSRKRAENWTLEQSRVGSA